jgi:peptidoglycan/LPS O-acetylase OafA/YrhL
MWPDALEYSRGRLATMPALDGIRAVAIAAVVLYHGDIIWTPGGLLGVEVFFVLSGYLITSLLVSELQAGGAIAIGRFLKRRARRLLPALFVMLALVSAAFVLWWPGEVARTRGDVAAAATYTSNWYLIGTHHSYFSAFARPSPFGHLWSLAIEEQFYLLWPPILFLLWKLLRDPRRVAGAVLGLAGVSVGALSLIYSGGDPSRVYYGTDTRASALLIGAALALLWRPSDETRPLPRLNPWLLDAATLLSGAILVWAFMRFDDQSPFTYRPGLLMVSLATASLIAACVHPDARVGRLLGLSPLRWLGKRSYSIYIWYFPVFAVTRPGVDLNVTVGTAFALRAAITLTFAELSYRFVEEPIRHGAMKRWFRYLAEREGSPSPDRRSMALGMSGAAVIAATVACSLVVAMVGAPTPVAAGPPSPPVTSVDLIADTVIPVGPPGPANLNPPVALGDSVMSGARAALRTRLGRVLIDAAVGRHVEEGIAILARLRHAGRLGHVVIVHLGNNGRFTTDEFERMMKVLVNVDRVVFVTVKVPRRWETSVNTVLWAGVARHPNTVLVDWRHLWMRCPGKVFGSDGTHLSAAGGDCYAKAIAAAAAH